MVRSVLRAYPGSVTSSASRAEDQPMDDVFTPSEATGSSGAPKPNVIDLASRAASEVGKNPAGYLLAGLVPTVVAITLTVLAVFGAYGFMFAGMVPGVFSDDPDEGFLIGLGIGLGVMFPLILLAMLGVAPMQASLYRAVWRSITAGEPLTIGSATSTFGQDLGRVLGFTVLYAVAMLAGAMLCY